MPRSLPRRNIPFVVPIVFMALTAWASCSHDSYLKVTLISGDSPFTDIATIQVLVRNSTGTQSATLNYDARSAFDAGPISFSQSKTLSIAFTPNVFGDVELTVNAFDSSGCAGAGTQSATINRGTVSEAPLVTLRHTSSCSPPSDGGTSVDGNVTFPGCDPGTPGTCPGNQVCFVNCPAKKGECIAGGTKASGEACTTNNDCVPGTQCFQYLCGVKVCLEFCSANDQCAPTLGGGGASGAGGSGAGGSGAGGSGAGGSGAGGAGGGGGSRGAAGSGGGASGASAGATGGAPSPIPPSSCKDPVVCGAVTTTYKTCSFACDPRGAATNGCPAGLLCFLSSNPGGQDSPDCDCPAPTRVRLDGASCASGTDCAPGFICNMMSGTQLCRKLCDLNAPTDCTAPRTCKPLQNNTFGVCL